MTRRSPTGHGDDLMLLNRLRQSRRSPASRMIRFGSCSLAVLGVLVALTGCAIEADVGQQLQDSIDAITQQSADWQDELAALEDKLDKDATALADRTLAKV